MSSSRGHQCDRMLQFLPFGLLLEVNSALLFGLG